MNTVVSLQPGRAATGGFELIPCAYPAFERELSTFLHGPLQNLNEDIESGKARTSDFLNAWTPTSELLQAAHPFIYEMGQPQARELLRRLGFVVSSLEYHLRRNGESLHALQLLGGVEEVLINLGKLARHIPRDSHYTVWLWNTGLDSIRFTTDPQEKAFAFAVTETDRLHSDSCMAIREICRAPEIFATPDAVQLLRRGEANTHEICGMYQTFRKPHQAGELTPDFFMCRLRTMLLAYEVGGAMHSGPNAANVASQVSLDFLTGFAAPSYFQQWALKRMQHMVPEDYFTVTMDARQTIDLATICLAHLGISSDVFVSLTESEIAHLIWQQPACLRSAVAAYAAFAKEQIRLSGIHFSLIKSHLIHAQQRLTPEQQAKLPVQPDRGTGHTDHKDTFSIFEMRHNHPVISRLIRATALLQEAEVHDEA
jgi:hypothetical protein